MDGTKMESSSDAQTEAVLETLGRRGWVIKDTQEVKAIVRISSVLLDDGTNLVDSVESELLNSDLRSIGGNSLPDISHLRKSSSCLEGPKIFQISSVRDISRSSIDDLSKSTGGRRLLRLNLTDGHNEIIAVEYSHIPSISDNVVPGTKIRLENKAAVHNGILCLTPKVVTVLGGVVQSLYEEWKMNQKYSGMSRSSLRLSHDGASGGPPPFQKLDISSVGYTQSKLQDGRPVSAIRRGEIGLKGKEPRQKLNNVDANLKSASNTQKNEDKPSTSGTRPKEVVEANPIQNQAASQKLLQKMSQDKQGGQHPRGRKHRGKGRQEELGLVTLEEYENRKSQALVSTKFENPDISRDEELALRLQNQFNLEDPKVTGADDIRMSMFKFDRDHGGSQGVEYGRRGSRRGRGRGRGRGS